MKWAAALVMLAVTVLAGYWGLVHGGPPVAPFAKVSRQRLVSTLSTNGKIEPSEWAVLRAPRAARLASLTVTKGAQVGRGQVIGQLEDGAKRAEVVAAEARVAQAQADQHAAIRGAPLPVVAELAHPEIARRPTGA